MRNTVTVWLLVFGTADKDNIFSDGGLLSHMHDLHFPSKPQLHSHKGF